MSSRRSHARLFKAVIALVGSTAFSFLVLCPAPASAQSARSAKTWTPPRTADGHPDLQGVWTNSTFTPVERPAEFANESSISEGEAVAYEKRVLKDSDRDRRDGGADADVGRAYNELFFERGEGLARIDGRARTSIVIDPPNGRIPPYTPEARERITAAAAEARKHPADRAQDRSLAERCVYWATTGPPMLPGPYNNSYQIVQTRDYVMIMVEMIHETRIIPMDGRPHAGSNMRAWIGDSRGHWEGDTLVVETSNFTGKTRFRGSDENLRVTERFQRVGPETILYRFTIDDPTVFAKPWTGELPFHTISNPIYEYACHEGNYALVDILAGARAEEKKAGK